MAKVLHFLIVIFGLALFEIITSIDNAVVNAHVLKTLPFWLAPLNTFILISIFLYLSYREIKYYEKI
jgi:hypothetical protein